MRLTALTKIKHGVIYEALVEVGWTQSELARRIGVTPGTIGDFINLKRKPSADMAQRIQNAFTDAEVYIDILEAWPDDFVYKDGLKLVQTTDVPMENLLEHERERLLLGTDPARALDRDMTRDRLSQAIGELPARTAHVLRERWFEGKTLGEIGNELGISAETVRMIERQALLKLRHPARMKRISGENGS